MNGLAHTWFRPEVRRGLALPILILVIWTVISRFGLANPRILIPPLTVWHTAVARVAGGQLWANLWASLTRDLIGCALGTALGLVVGGAMGLSRPLERLWGPSFHAAKQVALFAWIPLMSVWCGSGEPAKIVFIALSAFYPVVMNTQEGFRSVDVEYLEVARVFRYTRLQVLRKVILPAAAPSICSGIHQALIYAWLGTIGAEYLLQAGPGIGNLMIDGREQFAMDLVLLGLVVTGLVGFGQNAVAKVIEGRILRWRVRNV